jgi:hypothetical protein
MMICTIWSAELKLSGLAAPFSRVHIGDGLREAPMVSAGIFGAVLTLAIRKCGGRPENAGAVLPRAFVVGIHIFGPVP